MRYFALEEIHNRDNGEWISHNLRLGGYSYLSRAIAAIRRHAQNGRVLNEHRQIVVLLQEGRVTYPTHNGT